MTRGFYQPREFYLNYPKYPDYGYCSFCRYVVKKWEVRKMTGCGRDLLEVHNKCNHEINKHLDEGVG